VASRAAYEWIYRSKSLLWSLNDVKTSHPVKRGSVARKWFELTFPSHKIRSPSPRTAPRPWYFGWIFVFDWFIWVALGFLQVVLHIYSLRFGLRSNLHSTENITHFHWVSVHYFLSKHQAFLFLVCAPDKYGFFTAMRPKSPPCLSSCFTVCNTVEISVDHQLSGSFYRIFLRTKATCLGLLFNVIIRFMCVCVFSTAFGQLHDSFSASLLFLCHSHHFGWVEQYLDVFECQR
jgi:hypothetical protein